MKNQIFFNSGTTYHKGSQKMDIVELSSIDVKSTKKENLPWLQIFNTGYRVTNSNIDWQYWNGCIYIDIDSKHAYKKYKFDKDLLLKLLYEFLSLNYYTNFYCIQQSNSKTGYHIIFYFNIDKNEDNYKKCQYWCTKIVEEAFISIGAKEIIYYEKVIDNCTLSPVQGMYLTNNELLFGNIDKNSNPWFGQFDISNIEIEYKIVNHAKYINEDGTNNFTVNGNRSIIKTKKYYEHRTRMAIYMSLISILKEKEIVDKVFSEIVNEQFIEDNGHSIKFFINEPQKDAWFDKYDIYKEHFVRPYLLKEVGFNVIETFIPEVYSTYKVDKVYKISSEQFLGDIDIEFKKDKINHIFAGCGFGKTTWTKKLGKTKRVCVISPLTSINKDAFSDENGWLIIDNNYKDIVRHIFNGKIKDALSSTWNICTTWESFSLYEMYNYDFDYIIIDEIHTLYMYDYRINSIRQLKENFPKANGIKVIMTGTPSYELKEFDCYNIQIKKDQPKTKAEFLFYNESSTGWIYKDIKKWTKNSNHVAIIFKDKANYKDIDNMSLEGIDCDIFNSNYKSNVEYILNENNIKNNVTIFSVYGQAGINLYIDINKKVRLYILNKNGLGIIQYANRVRNKQVIDKVIIPFKKEQIDNKIEKIDDKIDIEEAERKCDIINSTIKPFDIFDIKQKSILLLRFGLISDCLDKIGDKFSLNIGNYNVYKLIKNIENYEKQIQIIYNRLIENDFEVSYNYLIKDEKTNKVTKMRSNQLAGNIVNFDFSQIMYDKNGNIYIKPNDKLLKVSTGNLIEILTNIFNHIRRNRNDIEEVFNEYIKGIIKKKNTVTKKDLENIDILFYLQDNWNNFYNSNFIKAMENEDWDDIKLTTAFIRSVYNNKMTKKDWQTLSDEAYLKIHNFRKVFNDYTDIIESFSYNNENLNIILDEKTQEIYNYIYCQHTNGKKGGQNSTKQCVVTDKFKHPKKYGLTIGQTFKSTNDLCEFTNKSRKTVSQWRKLAWIE